MTLEEDDYRYVCKEIEGLHEEKNNIELELLSIKEALPQLYREKRELEEKILQNILKEDQ